MVEGPGARFTDYDQQLLNQLFADRAVIIIITKCDIAHQEQIDNLKQAIKNANLKHVVDVIPVSAQPRQGRSSRGRNRGATPAQTNPVGLKELVATTIHNIPDSRQIAFVAAQKADLSEKDQQARKLIMRSSLQAASVSIGGGLSPVPFAEAPFLVGIQMNMLAGIANIYDVGIDLSQIVGAFVTQTLATEVGKMLATEALKVAVGLGTLISAGAKATISGSITITMGFTFRSLYHTIAQRGLEGKLDGINEEWVKSFLESTSKNISKDVKNKSKLEEYDYHERQ